MSATNEADAGVFLEAAPETCGGSPIEIVFKRGGIIEKDIFIRLKIVVWVLCGALAPSAPVSAETLDEIIGKNFEAGGGEEARMAVQTARMIGTMHMGDSVTGAIDAPYTVEFKRPDRVRVESSMQGVTAVQAFGL